MLEEKYINFFEKIKLFKEEQKKQKQRGLNDYNMVNVVRKENAEVGMHSNVIYSLIDPNGLHYQDDLFLRIFIKNVLEINDFGDILSVQAEESTNENRRVDFTIKSNNYYIGIEMKVDASDLENQISHYYDDLKEKASKDSNQKVLIYYLTKNGKDASLNSHNNKVTPTKISFKEHILNWIDKCQQEVKNITNLNEAFENYKDIVKKVLNIKNAKVGTMENKLLEMFDENKENFMIASSIYNNFDQIKYKIVSDFFSKYLIDYFTSKFNEIKEYKDWEITVNMDTLRSPDTYPIRIKKRNSNWKLIFQFGFVTSNMNSGYYGISVSDLSVPLSDFIKSNHSELLKWKRNSKISLFWDFTPRNYTYATENLVAFKFEPEVTSQEYFNLFENTIKTLKTNYHTTLEKINEDLDSFLVESKKL